MAHNYPPPPGPQQHTQVTKRGANHSLHVLLTVLTCGLWAITGWPIAAPQPPPGPLVQPGPYGPPQGGSWPAQGPYPPQGQPPTHTTWGQPPQQ